MVMTKFSVGDRVASIWALEERGIIVNPGCYATVTGHKYPTSVCVLFDSWAHYSSPTPEWALASSLTKLDS